MKKIILLIFICCLITTACLKIAKEQETVTTGQPKMKSESFASHFGIMHPQEYYEEVDELGIHWERPHPGPFIWGDIEKKEGKYNWRETDEWILRAQENNFNTAPTIWPYANWDQEVCHSDEKIIKDNQFKELPDRRHKPCSEEKYKKFIKALVSRYDGDGINDMAGLKFPILVYEISNEPTMQGQPDPDGNEGLYFFKGSAKDYIDMLQWSYEAIKEVNEKVLVINAGMAGMQNEAISFWQEAIDLGADNYIDIWSFHNVGQDNKFLLADKALEFFTKNNIDKPFWIAENEYRDPDNAAADIIKSHCRAFALGVDKIFWTSIQTEKKFSYNSGILASFASDVKAMNAYSEFIAAVDYFSHVEKVNEGKYIFSIPPQEPGIHEYQEIEVFWDESDLNLFPQILEK